MTEHEMNIAIAEACGATWQDIPPCEAYDQYHPKRVLSFHNVGGSRFLLPIPDCETGDATSIPEYTKDLNAMHEAEEKLITFSDVLTTKFRLELWSLTEKEGRLRDPVHATARQRAEAFLKTLNLWKE